MFKASLQTLEQFKNVLQDLPEDMFRRPCSTLSEATVGQHTRHIIELYKCLIEGYSSGEVCYDNRKRDQRIEQELKFAILQLGWIQDNLEKENKSLFINYELDERGQRVESNYLREVMYNLEHAIHHEALIKVAIQEFSEMTLPESFGVAPSTIQFRKQCVQ